MAQLVYIDETGSVGKGAAQQPLLTLVAVLVQEDKVQPLSEGMRRVASHRLETLPDNFEFHGNELWGGRGPWSGKQPPELIAVYEAVINLLEELDLSVAHSSIHKEKLHLRYHGSADGNAYLLALQFLLEKIDAYGSNNRIVVADEAKEHQLRAIHMVADMQEWGYGEVPGARLRTIIDSLHFVQSNASPGVQMADLVAYVIQRSRRPIEGHADAATAILGLREKVDTRTMTWREAWPR